MVHRRSEQPDKTVTFIDLAEKASIAVKNTMMELKQGRNNNDLYVKQLEKIYKEIEQMKVKKDPKKFKPSYPRIITDSWDYNNNLTLILMDLNEIYLKLL